MLAKYGHKCTVQCLGSTLLSDIKGMQDMHCSVQCLGSTLLSGMQDMHCSVQCLGSKLSLVMYSATIVYTVLLLYCCSLYSIVVVLL